MHPKAACGGGVLYITQMGVTISDAVCVAIAFLQGIIIIYIPLLALATNSFLKFDIENEMHGGVNYVCWQWS